MNPPVETSLAGDLLAVINALRFSPRLVIIVKEFIRETQLPLDTSS